MSSLLLCVVLSVTSPPFAHLSVAMRWSLHSLPSSLFTCYPLSIYMLPSLSIYTSSSLHLQVTLSIQMFLSLYLSLSLSLVTMATIGPKSPLGSPPPAKKPTLVPTSFPTSFPTSPVSSRTRSQRKRYSSIPWIESIDPTSQDYTTHRGTCHSDIQARVGQWLGLSVEIEKPSKSTLDQQEIKLICCALLHTVRIDAGDKLYVLTLDEATQVLSEGSTLTTRGGCQCNLHKSIEAGSLNEDFSFFSNLVALMVQNSGTLYGGNGTNIAIQLAQYLLKRAGYKQVLVAAEGTASVTSPISSHVCFRIGMENDSLVVDGTPHFYGQHFSLSSGVTLYIFVGKVKSKQAQQPIVQLALNALGLALKQKSSNIGVVLFDKSPLTADVFLGDLEDWGEKGRKRVSFRRVNSPAPHTLTDSAGFKNFAEAFIGLVNELLPLY